MNPEIKNRFTGKIIIEAGKYANIIEAVEKNKANLYGANLYRANLYGANLYRANLYRANLYGANLYRANLYGADLYGANLYRANLYGADLYGANLYRANLSGADLYGADLYGANLYRANLSGADLYGANLYRANLSGADLSVADGEKLKIVDNNSVLIIGPIGSRRSYMTAYKTDKGIYIKTGCYFDTVDNFKTAVSNKHKNTKHQHDYLTAIAFIKAVMRGDK